MDKDVNLKSVYKPSEDVVARDVQGEFIVIPVTSDIGDLDEAIYSLNETGRAIWERMDGKKSLEDIIDQLVAGFDSSTDQINKDVLGLTKELLKKNMLVEIKKT